MSRDVRDAFAKAMRCRGLIPPAEILADGRIHRCDAEGRNGRADGSYVLHLDDAPAGGLQNWRDGLGWEDWRSDGGERRLSADERRRACERIEALRRERDAETERRHAEAAERAAHVWSEAPEADDTHPYLVSKGVRAHGLRLDKKGRLIEPLRDEHGRLCSLQFIDENGNKRFLTGGKVGGCYHLLGEIGDTVAVAEGYATGATIHEVTGFPVAVAFDCGNLRPVAEALRGRYPTAKIILCADDDSRNTKNPGLTHARKAAQAVGGLLAVPDFGQDRPECGTDFNDLAQHAGPEAIRACVGAAQALPAAGTVEALLEDSGIPQLTAESSPATVEAALRALGAATAGTDSLRRELLVAEAKKRLKTIKVGGYAKLVDAAVGKATADDAAGIGSALDFSDPEPATEPVDGAALLSAIAEALGRYVVLTEGAADAIALWVLHTYALAVAWCSPLLVLTSASKRCGKTLVLELLGALARRVLSTSSVSPSALYRAIEAYSPTLLIDEADAFFGQNEELRGIVNSGHTRTSARVLRCVGDNSEPRAFSTWAAKAVAGIGNLADTLMDRAVVIPMRRRAPGERVNPLRRDRIGATLEPLRRAAVRWVADNAAVLRESDPDVPAGLNDRAADNWRPLLAIADAAGGCWPKRARTAAVLLSGGDAADDDAAVMLLGDIRSAFGGDNADKLATERLLAVLHAMEHRPWPEWRRDKPMSAPQLARVLRRFEIRPKTVRTAAGTAKGYEAADFADAWARYFPENGGAQTVTTSQPLAYMAETLLSEPSHVDTCSGSNRNNIKPEPEVTASIRNTSDRVTDRNAENTLCRNDCDVVTNRSAENGPSEDNAAWETDL